MSTSIFLISHALPEPFHSLPKGKVNHSFPWTWAGPYYYLDKKHVVELMCDFWGLIMKGNMVFTWCSLSRFSPLEAGCHILRTPWLYGEASYRLFGPIIQRRSQQTANINPQICEGMSTEISPPSNFLVEPPDVVKLWLV